MLIKKDFQNELSNKSVMKIEDLFNDWVDGDHATYYIACILGLIEFDSDLRVVFWENKGLFNTKNKLSTMLFHIIEELLEVGILEESEQGLYRYNKTFIFEYKTIQT